MTYQSRDDRDAEFYASAVPPMTPETPAADIVEEAREAIANCSGNEPSLSVLCRAADQAATEITRLRAREAELQRKLDEAVNMLERWQNWACGQRGGSPFLDTRRTLASSRGEG